MEETALQILTQDFNIHATNIKKSGYLVHKFEDMKQTVRVHIYECEATENMNLFDNDAIESNKSLNWFKLADIPDDKVTPDFKCWCEYLILGKKFIGR